MSFQYTVLLADDQGGDREALRDLLRGTGCAVLAEAHSTDDLLLRFEAFAPDIVILDASLPGTLDALVAIRQLQRHKHDVLVFATAPVSQQERLMEALTMGARDILTKPFQPRLVRRCLQQYL